MARKRKSTQLQENIFNTLNVGSVGMTGAPAFMTGGALYMSATGKGMPKSFRSKKPKFGKYKNLGF